MSVRWHKLIFSLCLGALFFLLSMLLVVPYTGGDQEWYRLFYQRLVGLGLAEVPLVQAITTGSAEPVYGYLMWAGANLGINKDIFVSALNAYLLMALTAFLRNNRSGYLFITLALTNFYAIVLLTSAERLKISYIILLTAALLKPGKLRAGLYLIAPLAHFQTIVLYAIVLAGKISRLRLSRKIRRGTFVAALVLVPLAAIVGAFIYLRYGQTILAKVSYYLTAFDILNVVNLVVLIFISLVVLKNKYESAIVFLTAALAALFLSGDRVNMIAVAIFCYFCVTQRRTSHPLVLATMGYFSAKSIFFVINIYLTGSGF